MTVDIIFPVKLTGKKSCYFNEATGLFFAVRACDYGWIQLGPCPESKMVGIPPRIVPGLISVGVAERYQEDGRKIPYKSHCTLIIIPSL